MAQRSERAGCDHHTYICCMFGTYWNVSFAIDCKPLSHRHLQCMSQQDALKFTTFGLELDTSRVTHMLVRLVYPVKSDELMETMLFAPTSLHTQWGKRPSRRAAHARSRRRLCLLTLRQCLQGSILAQMSDPCCDIHTVAGRCWPVCMCKSGTAHTQSLHRHRDENTTARDDEQKLSL